MKRSYKLSILLSSHAHASATWTHCTLIVSSPLIHCVRTAPQCSVKPFVYSAAPLTITGALENPGPPYQRHEGPYSVAAEISAALARLDTSQQVQAPALDAHPKVL